MTLKESVISTLRYTSHFDYPLTQKELWYWLYTDKEISFPKFQKALAGVKLPSSLKPFLLIKKTVDRANKEHLTQKKLKAVTAGIDLLKNIPLINFIGLTGSLSMDNPDPDSDVDLMLITSPGTLWIVRPLVVLLLKLTGQSVRLSNSKNIKDTICINLYLDIDDLVVPRQNFYTAHEILQVRPLFDKGGVYSSFLLANAWTKNFFANAYSQKETSHNIRKAKTSPFLKLTNFLLYNVQKAYMSKKITNETVTLTQAFFHPKNPYKRLRVRLGLK